MFFLRNNDSNCGRAQGAGERDSHMVVPPCRVQCVHSFQWTDGSEQGAGERDLPPETRRLMHADPVLTKLLFGCRLD
jgi:hypothetical protein